MPPSLHAVLSASSADRWLHCPPSARLSERLRERYVQQESPFAAEGTKAHALGEIKLRREIYRADGMTAQRLSRLPKQERQGYPGINDYRYKALRKDLGEIPTEMERATDSYCDVVMEKYLRAKEVDPSARIYLEQRLDFSHWVPSGFGTGDAIVASSALLEIIDFKYGTGVPVDAEGNPQLRLYGLGAISLLGALYDFTAVRETIVQPRLDRLREETLAKEDLLEWAQQEVVEKAKLAWRGAGQFCPGSHCRWCDARAVCSARVAEALKLFQYGFESPGLLADEQIPEILSFLDDAEAWIKDIRRYAEAQAKAGQRIPGYKLVRGKRPNRRWTDEEAVEATLLRAGYPPETFRETRLKSAGAVEKALGKTAFRALLEELTTQGDGSLILVSEKDPREEWHSADTVFSDLPAGLVSESTAPLASGSVPQSEDDA